MFLENKRIYNLKKDEPDKRDFISIFKNTVQIIKKKNNNKPFNKIFVKSQLH